MIFTVEALRYRSLKDICQSLSAFDVLIGPNASGKTTFLDSIRFVGDLAADGLEKAIERRTEGDLTHLVWSHENTSLELAVELKIPESKAQLLPKQAWRVWRYEVTIGRDGLTGENAILSEKVVLRTQRLQSMQQRLEFPNAYPPRSSLAVEPGQGSLTIIGRRRDGGYAYYHAETGRRGFQPSFKLGPRKSALGILPEDEDLFPVTTWAKGYLIEGIQTLSLNSAAMRKPSPPGRQAGFLPDGSNLPLVVDALKLGDPARFADWTSHVRTALPELVSVGTDIIPWNRHSYLTVTYRGGLTVPSWMVSDGTLRLLALTLPAYIPRLEGTYLIEEPENGIHPRAVEAVFQSLSSVYDAQVLTATHSPVILSLAEPAQILCFGKALDGSTDIVRGSEHPRLKDWRDEPNLGVLYASGVLG